MDFAFSASGQRLATISCDRSVLIWDMDELHLSKVNPEKTLAEMELQSSWADLASYRLRVTVSEGTTTADAAAPR